MKRNIKEAAEVVQLNNKSRETENNIINNPKKSIIQRIKETISEILGLDQLKITIGEGDYIELKSEFSKGKIVLGRVVNLFTRNIQGGEKQFCYEIEMYRSNTFSLVEIQNIFNGKTSLKTEIHEASKTNKEFKKVDILIK